MQKKIHTDTAVVLILSAHDPCGGAGIQADLETTIAHGCQPISVVTALTEQSLMSGLKNVIPQDADHFYRQTMLLLEEFTIATIKIGAIGSTDIIKALGKILHQVADIPVILDPVLAATTGGSFITGNEHHSLLNELMPLCSLITPNTRECKILGKQTTVEASVENLQQYGCRNILVTSAFSNENSVSHLLYENTAKPHVFKHTKLPGEYHGSGCTLSSSIAANLAKGDKLAIAVEKSISYTVNTLKTSSIHSDDVCIPNRFIHE